MASFWDMLTKGEGTPWGPMQTGMPTQPSMDLNAYTGMDTTPMLQAAKAGIGRNAAGAREQALARLRGAGVRGADTGAAVAGIAAQQAEAMDRANAQAALMDAQMRQQNRDAALRKYEMDLMGFAGEQGGRSNFWNALAGLGGQALGGYLGRK